jgi:hypothetical protein
MERGTEVGFMEGEKAESEKESVTDRWTVGGRLEGQTDRFMVGRTDGKRDGWMDRGMDRSWTQGWTEGLTVR